MDSLALAQTLITIARQDQFDEIGRLIVSDVKSAVGDKTLTAEKILQVLKQWYPNYDYDQRTENIILVYWDGRDTIKSVRGLREASNLTNNATQDEVEEGVVEE